MRERKHLEEIGVEERVRDKPIFKKWDEEV